MKLVLGLLAISFSLSTFSQLNMNQLGRIGYDTLHNAVLNDVWAYVDEDGNEYGLVGTTEGTGVVDLADPSAPVEIFWEPGTNSTWRDLKTFGDYAYITTEANEGLLIIDMTSLPLSAAFPTNYYFGPSGFEWQSAHNIYIDSAGYAYIFGANRDNGGVIILDLNTDPMNPVEVGVFDNWYVHDGYVQGNTMFLAHIGEGTISVVDVTDKVNPVLLGTKTTPSTFAHNIWPSTNGNFAFTTDELPFSYLTAYDVTDPANMIEVDRIQSSPGSGTIPHNVHVMGDYMVTSHYSDGVVIHDVSYPYNMVEVGYFETYPTQTTGYDGCWGAYPFLPSGIVLATDRTEGFFVLGANYMKAAYLEGTVVDAATLLPLDLVDIQITGDDQIEDTDVSGFYATGIATAGSYDVTYSKIGYYPQTISVPMVNDVIYTQDVQLVPIPPYSLAVTVIDLGTGLPVLNADIRLKASLLTHEGVTNALGQENFTLYYEESYDITVGHWGHVTECFSQVIDNSTGSLTVYIERGIYDDFAFDFGWSTNSTAATGLWERGIPFGTSSGSAPDADYVNDCDSYAYLTGNDSNPDPDFDDVDAGAVTLVSPVIDLSGFADPYVNYVRWFYTKWGPNPPDDSLRIEVSNGMDVVEIDAVGDEPSTFGIWQPQSIRLLDHIALTSTMQFFFKTSDFDPDVNITEAGVDLFFINESAVGLEEADLEKIIVAPNPTNGIVKVSNLLEAEPYELRNVNGQLVQSGTISPASDVLDLNSFDSGIYFLSTAGQVVKIFKTK
ncbi:MAG: choice-of-anchor B family protein [Crocinitomicaceae bacterium]|nr:choice-of-anchor B family protein [Crocinitomicaceae bacterium]MDG1658313.1 choice-of-anchor B family protein [Crocinitomicaceae bacterium]